MMNSIENLFRENILQLSGYSSARLESTDQGVLLNANEYPDDRACSGLNRYPEPQPLDLINKLAEIYRVNERQLLLTRGADEGIDLLIRAFCEPKQDNVLICPPTYGMYSVSSAIQNVTVKEVPLTKNYFQLDMSEIIKNCKSGVKLVFICSPNNPTGNIIRSENILELCSQLSGIACVVVDEAYIEFASSSSLSSNISEIPNLIVLRTLSKAYGLAGARVGTVIASEAIIQILKKIIAPYPIPKPVIDLVLQRLNSSELDWRWMIRERDILAAQLEKMNFVKKVYPSDANFILIKVENASAVMNVCKKNNILIRDRSKPLCGEYVRISVGTPSQNKLLLEVLNDVSA